MAESSPVVRTTEPSEQSPSAQDPNNNSNVSGGNASNSGKKTVDDYNFIKVLGEGSYATVIIFLIIYLI